MHAIATFAALAATTAQAFQIYTSFSLLPNGQPTALPSPTPTTSYSNSYTTLAAYGNTKLQSPGMPGGVPNKFNVDLAQNAAGASIKQKGTFFGYSIELSVVAQFVGRNSTHIHVPFLNFLANIKSRVGQGPVVRLGGNSQENTVLFSDNFPNNQIINKTMRAGTVTPAVDIDMDFLWMMKNISGLLDVAWYLGLPYAYEDNGTLNNTGIAGMMKAYEDILGPNLIGVQLGNEPDLYGVENRRRPTDYPIGEYFKEWQGTLDVITGAGIQKTNNILGPSTCCNNRADSGVPWAITDVLDQGYINRFKQYLSQVSVQFYPTNNCNGGNDDVQGELSNFLDRSYTTGPFYAGDRKFDFAAASRTVNQAGLPFVMFETNTASCAGLEGISDAFAASLWGIDWAMQLAYQNFSQVLFHFGGQGAAYNAFVPPPPGTNKTFQWTVGPIYYAHLVVAEALGSTNTSQVLELNMNGGNTHTPGYAIYENGQPARVLMMNNQDDGGKGTGTYTATIRMPGGQIPASVDVRYLISPSVTEHYNISWGGQTLGNGIFTSDGRMQGDVKTVTINCVPNTGCQVPVPAPGAALVFLSSQAESESQNTQAIQTFPTTTQKTHTLAGPTVDQGVLATSNGRGGKKEAVHALGSTSHGKQNAAGRTIAIGVAGTCLAALGAGALVLGFALGAN